RSEPARQLGGGDGAADCHAVTELHSLCFQLRQPKIEHRLLQLELGNAKPQQSSRPLVLLEDDDIVPKATQLLRGSEAGRTGADDGHFESRATSGGARLNPTLRESAIGDGLFDVPDTHRIVDETEHTGGFARR